MLTVWDFLVENIWAPILVLVGVILLIGSLLGAFGQIESWGRRLFAGKPPPKPPRILVTSGGGAHSVQMDEATGKRSVVWAEVRYSVENHSAPPEPIYNVATGIYPRGVPEETITVVPHAAMILPGGKLDAATTPLTGPIVSHLDEWDVLGGFVHWVRFEDENRQPWYVTFDPKDAVPKYERV